MLPKKAKNRLLLKNWKHISLLNTDYKIIANVLATRMQNVLPSIINDDQTVYLKGRYIGQNIRIIEDVSFCTKISKILRIILCIDFEKAFDSLNWNCKFKTFHKFNFGETFIYYVKTMYNNIEATVLNNGNTSTFCKPQKGV